MKKLVVAAVGAVIVVPAAAAWAPYPPITPACSISDTTVERGQQVTISGDNWLPNDSVDFTFDQDDPSVIVALGSAPTDGAGSFSAQVTIPQSAHEGSFLIIVSGRDANGEPVACDTAIIGTVVAAGGGGGGGDGGGLAVTGFALWVFLAVALGLLAAGVVMVAASRARSTGEPRETDSQVLVRRARLAFLASAGALVAVVALATLVPRLLGETFSIRESFTPLTLAVAAAAAVSVFVLVRRPARGTAR